MHSLLTPYSIFLIQFATCHLLHNFTTYIPFSEYRVISTDLSFFQNLSNVRKNNAPFTFKVEFSTNETYEIAVLLKNIEVMDWKTDFHIYGENGEDQINIKKENFEVVKGFVISQEDSSSVVGYIKDTLFYGTIALKNIIYYIEDLKKYPEIYSKYKNSKYNAVIYKDNSLNFSTNSNTNKEIIDNFNDQINFIKVNDEKDLFKSIVGKGKVCTLFILVDNSFLRRIHNNDIRSATLHILNSVEKANSLFRSTDFDEDGFPDNIGFLIKYFIVLQSEKSPMNLLPLYDGYPIEGATYINTFSQYKLLNEVCLGVAFTGHTFKNGVLGISYTAEPTDRNFFKFSLGGICDRPHKYQPGKNLNTLAISPMLKNGNIVPQYIFDLSLTHELGHSFGSDHDNSKECIGYLMTSHTPRDSQRKRFIFSSCSKQTIMKTIVSKGHCFENYEDPFCGNGIVETGEDCDCGTARDCQYFDACCVPQGQDDSCKVNKRRGYQCHPSQGICCTSICTYKNLSQYNLNCQQFTEECPCKGKPKPCSCGVNGHCAGNVCSSDECARISLKECECPAYFRSKKCRTCCMHNNICSPSSILTEKMIRKDESLIEKLKQLENKTMRNVETAEKYGFHMIFSKNNVSIKLYFREVDTDDYCLLFGKVGICGRNYRCFTATIRHIYPSLRTGGSNKKDVSKIVMFLNILVLIYRIICPLLA